MAYPAHTRCFKAQVQSNAQVNDTHMLLEISPMSEAMHPKPGQFYMVSASGSFDPLLKRPFCYFGHDDGNIKILYRVRGKGTELLSGIKEGGLISVLGPLGNPYPMPKGKEPIIAAGGVAIASVFPLIKELGGRANVVYGGRTSAELLFIDEIKSMSKKLITCTDDGSFGLKGNVVDGLKALEAGSQSIIYICGPVPMIKAAVRYSIENRMSGYVSMEEYMACGIGACMGCVVNTKKGYKRVCKEGPVFSIDEIINEP